LTILTYFDLLNTKMKAKMHIFSYFSRYSKNMSKNSVIFNLHFYNNNHFLNHFFIFIHISGNITNQTTKFYWLLKGEGAIFGKEHTYSLPLYGGTYSFFLSGALLAKKKGHFYLYFRVQQVKIPKFTWSKKFSNIFQKLRKSR
jgi:hypothetical protein